MLSPRLCSLFALLLLGLKPATGATTSTKANIPNAPPGNSEKLVPTLLSFSLEADRWPDWAGRDTRNIHTFNALTNYARLTGKPPNVRIGANSEDKTAWDPKVDIISASFPAPSEITPYPEATSLNVSDEYYCLSKWMPRGTDMTWGLNFAYDNDTNAVNMAQSISRAFSPTSKTTKSGVVLRLIELGNEPDLYRNKSRPSNWTVSQFVQNWIENMTPVVKAVRLTVGGRVGVIAGSFATQAFTAAGSFGAGILESEPGKYITHMSQHRYSGVFCNGGNISLRAFMSKSAVRGNLTVFKSDIDATRSRGLAYVMGETGSIACHGAPGVSNTAGAALWTVDYTLQAATLGMQEVYFHAGVGFKYNFFQPIKLDRSPLDNSPLSPPSSPYLLPSYYAGLVINTAVGGMAASGKTKIVELELSAPNLSGYAIYEAGKPVRAVFVNLNAWVKDDEGVRERSAYHIDLGAAPIVGKKPARKDMRVKRLNVAYADDTANLTWGGQSWETPEFLVSGKEVFERTTWDKGVDIRESEAILVWF